MRYVYLGNIHDPSGSSTCCRQCGKILIGRDWYEPSTRNLLPGGECKKCGIKCAGISDGPPAAWQRKQPAIEMK